MAIPSLRWGKQDLFRNQKRKRNGNQWSEQRGYMLIETAYIYENINTYRCNRDVYQIGERKLQKFFQSRLGMIGKIRIHEEGTHHAEYKSKQMWEQIIELEPMNEQQIEDIVIQCIDKSDDNKTDELFMKGLHLDLSFSQKMDAIMLIL
jgi:hypothetical protein